MTRAEQEATLIRQTEQDYVRPDNKAYIAVRGGRRMRIKKQDLLAKQPDRLKEKNKMTNYAVTQTLP